MNNIDLEYKLGQVEEVLVRIYEARLADDVKQFIESSGETLTEVEIQSFKEKRWSELSGQMMDDLRVYENNLRKE